MSFESKEKPMPKIEIDGHPIGTGFPPFIIAELSANHNGDLGQAKRIIRSAAEQGATAVKLQTYTADTITLKSDAPDFQIKGTLWEGRTLYELYEEAHTPWDWHEELFAEARNHGLTIFSSPFDSTAVDLLEDLNAPAYKIASFEAIDLPLIRYVAGTKKPMIISTGMADKEEISEAVAAARDGGCEQLALLHCVSGYPAPARDYNLRTLQDMAEEFGVVVGLSDHTIDNATAIASIALGAAIVEKHFTLDRNGGGPDDSFSLEPADLKQLVESTRTAHEALGKVDYGRKSSEQGNVQFRRSLYFVRDLEVGDTIGAEDIRSVRPGYGMAPKYLDQLIGKQLQQPARSNSPVTPDHISLSD